MLAGEAFESALEEFCAPGDPERTRLLATYGARGLRRMLTGVYETLRSAGRELVLEVSERPGLEARIEELREAARCVVEDTAGLEKADKARASAARALELLEHPPASDRLLDLSDVAARGGPRDLFASYEEARVAVEQAALDELAARDRGLLEDLLGRFADAYAAAKAAESALDFEDLQLTARDLLRDHAAIRERESWRFRSVLVDEFQDTNRLQCELIDLLATEDLFFVGDEFQSIYRFRHADVEVFRERREASGGVLALTENYRSRPEVLQVDQPPLLVRLRRLVPAPLRRGQVRGPGVRPGGRAARHRQVDVQGQRHPLARRGGEARREPSQGARRFGRGDSRRDRPPLRRGHGCAPLRAGAPRARPTDIPRDRPRLLPPTAGRRPARLPAPAAQPVRRRGARQRARVAVRRRLERRAAPPPARGRAPPALRRPRALTAGAGYPSATRGSSAPSASATTAWRRSRRECPWSGSASGS